MIYPGSMMVRCLVIGALLLGPAIASGNDLPRAINGPGDAPEFGFVGVTRDDGLVLARQVIPAPTAPITSDTGDGGGTTALAQSRIVYLNKNGVTLSPGTNDARVNRSTVVNAQTAISGWSANPTLWAETVTCMRELFAEFDLTIVDTDPGNVPHIEAVFGGTPQQVGLDGSVAGVSPFTTDCSVIENSVVFTFTNGFAFTSREACEIMAQEVAHSFGLDHELLAADPMTYLPYGGNRTFQDQTATCGETLSDPRQCGINGSVCRANQNSVQLLRERLGVADAVLPAITSMSPSNNTTVPPGFLVKAIGTDNSRVVGAVLKIDGVQRESLTGAGPFTFATPGSLSEGPHTIVVEVSDGKNFKAETRNVIVKIGAPPPPDDFGGDELGNDVIGGCATGGNGGSSALFAVCVALVLGVTRRRRATRAPAA